MNFYFSVGLIHSPQFVGNPHHVSWVDAAATALKTLRQSTLSCEVNQTRTEAAYRCPAVNLHFCADRTWSQVSQEEISIPKRTISCVYQTYESREKESLLTIVSNCINTLDTTYLETVRQKFMRHLRYTADLQLLPKGWSKPYRLGDVLWAYPPDSVYPSTVELYSVSQQAS